jgi:prepilin-type N-terminal cleavage/methylation domain-containing protein
MMRRGFTLVEMTIVLLILTIASAVVVPAMIAFGRDRVPQGSDLIIQLLRESRSLAIRQAATVTVVLDPETGHFRVDSVSAMGAGRVVEDTLELGAVEYLETDLPRLRYVFVPSGAAFADTVTVRGGDSTRIIIVDPWSGRAYAPAR